MRHLTDWVESFVRYTDGIRSPEVYRRWSALSCVAAALERKCHIHLSDHDVYPNLYIMLAGPPAAGKTLACNEGRKLLRKVNGIKLGPQDVSEASLYDKLQAAIGTVHRDNKMPLMHHSLSVQVPEMGTLLKPGDLNLYNALTSLYDCEESFEKSRRTTDDNSITNCFLNMIVCGTPSNVSEVFTPRVLEQGLPSRFVIAYSEKPSETPPLIRTKIDAENRKASRSDQAQTLITDLAQIHRLSGEFLFDEIAAKEFVSWYEKGMIPIVEDPKFSYYNDRRHIHITKLMMTISASRRESMIILPEDFSTARDLLVETEKKMPQALEYSGANQYYAEMVKLVRYIASEHARTSAPVPEWKVRKRMARDIPITLVDQVLAQLILANEIKHVGDPPSRGFKPAIPLH